MEEIDISVFNAETLHYLVNLAVPIEEDQILSYTDPDKQADERNIPILSEWFFNDRLNRSQIIIGMKFPKDMLPCKIVNFLGLEEFSVNQEKIMFETPIFVKSLDEYGYTPYVSTEGKWRERAAFLVVSLPSSLINKCGKWWNFVDSNEEITILPDLPKIKYTVVNRISVARD